MDIKDAIKKSTVSLKKRGIVISWSNVAKLMGDPSKSPDAYRCKYNRELKKSGESKEKAVVEPKVILNPIEVLKTELRKQRTIEELCNSTGLDHIQLLGHIEQLRLNGYDIAQHRYDKVIAYSMNKNVQITYNEFRHYHDVDEVIKIALISDTHIGSRYWQKTFLQLAYQDFKNENIDSVYHVGDVSDGLYTNRPGNIYELYCYGFDDQLDEICKVYPQVEGITTYFITGNHDATHIMNGGANIGKAIEKRRVDMKYLGHEFAKVWLTPKVDIDLIHPRDGSSSYALSYKLQKRIDAISGGSKPKLMAVGHYHKYFSMLYRNISAFSLASFQAQSPFLRGNGISSDVGYLILEIKVNPKGDLIELNSRYKPLYETISENY